MVNAIIALSLGLTAGGFFFLAATFPALTIPLLSIAVTGATTLIVFTILKVINTVQAIPQMVNDIRDDLNTQIDAKYTDLKATTQEMVEDLKNTSVQTVNDIATDFQKVAIETANTNIEGIKKDTIAALQTTAQQELNRAKLSSRKVCANYAHLLLVSNNTNEMVQSEPKHFKVNQFPILGALGASYGLLSGSIMGLTLGAAVGATNYAYRKYQPHRQAFLKKTEDNKLHCKFLNDHNEIQETVINVNFLEADTVLTEALLTQHEDLILEYINLSIIQNNVKHGTPFAVPENIEPQPEMDLLDLPEPITFTGKKNPSHVKNDTDSTKKPRKNKKKNTSPS